MTISKHTGPATPPRQTPTPSLEAKLSTVQAQPPFSSQSLIKTQAPTPPDYALTSPHPALAPTVPCWLLHSSIFLQDAISEVRNSTPLSKLYSNATFSNITWGAVRVEWREGPMLTELSERSKTLPTCHRSAINEEKLARYLNSTPSSDFPSTNCDSSQEPQTWCWEQHRSQTTGPSSRSRSVFTPRLSVP